MPAENNYDQQLQAAGQKTTRSRQGILAALADSDKPLTAGDIFLYLTQSGTATSQATVYRNLKLLERGGLIQKAGSWQGHALYQKLGRHQHHLICLDCRKVVNIAGCPLENYSQQIGAEAGFTVTEHLLELYGYCQNCQAGQEKLGDKKILPPGRKK